MITDWYCFEHEDFDIRIRNRGRYTCDAWGGPDGDPCWIRLAEIIEHGETDINDIPVPNRTAR